MRSRFSRTRKAKLPQERILSMEDRKEIADRWAVHGLGGGYNEDDIARLRSPEWEFVEWRGALWMRLAREPQQGALFAIAEVAA